MIVGLCKYIFNDGKHQQSEWIEVKGTKAHGKFKEVDFDVMNHSCYVLQWRTEYQY